VVANVYLVHEGRVVARHEALFRIDAPIAIVQSDVQQPAGVDWEVDMKQLRVEDPAAWNSRYTDESFSARTSCERIRKASLLTHLDQLV